MLKDNIKNEYNAIAHTWRNKVWVTDPEFKEKIVQFAGLKGDEKILDVGIGAGDLSGLFGSVSVIGIDISKSMLDECKKIHPNFELILGDAEKLPFQDNLFDCVCCRNFLQNFNDPQKAFQEMVRVLRPGGKILVFESAVYEVDRKYPTDFCLVVEPFHPLFPSHELLKELFVNENIKNIEQSVVGVHKKWLQKWKKSKGATDEQALQGYKVCENYPHWYKEKYEMKFFPEDTEIESTLTFSFLKGIKRNAGV